MSFSLLRFTMASFLGLFVMSPLGAMELRLEEVVDRALASDPSLAALRAERNLRSLEGEAANSEYGPKLSAFTGLMSEDTLDETRSGPIFGLEGRWNLYRGGQDLLNRKLSEESSSIVELERQSSALEQTYKVRILFYKALAEKEKQILLREELKLTEKQARAARKRISAGLSTNTDDLEFTLREDELRADEIKSRLEEKKILEELKILLKIEEAEVLGLKGSLGDPNEKASSKAKLSEHPSLLSLKKEEVKLGLQKDLLSASYKPDLNLYANFGRLNPVSWRDIDVSKPESVVGLTLTIPLYDAGSRNKKAEIIQKSLELSTRKLEALSQRLQSEKMQNKLELEEIDAQRKLNERRLASSKEYFQKTISEYELGVKNSPDVLGAMERWFSAKSRKIDLNLKNQELWAEWQRLHGAVTKNN